MATPTTTPTRSPERRPRRLPPGVRKAVLSVHVIASVALLGEVWVLVVLNTAAATTDDAGLALSAYRLMSVLVFAGGIPLSTTALVTGLILAFGTAWGLLRHAWVFAKLVLLVAVVLIGMFLFTPERMAAEAAAGPLADAEQWVQTAVVATQAVLLVVATALSVYKPRRTLQAGRGRS
ncbi:hypothetical protein ACIBFB_16630 [Nocardiopsis sp. NPDC050513]|uniref:hypothetical protein n=1 Tax=Nocardiopsis sp. NPDC050513 TaxID=3364338 RepID=UPI00379DBCB2